MNSIRINKYLAEQGIASRREADKLIVAGKILINGKVAQLGDKVKDSDKVESRQLKAESYQYLAYYKPRGEETKERYRGSTSVNSPRSNLGGLFPIGRLDKDSEGLLLITNDGRLTGQVIGSETKYEKEYVVTVDKKIAGIDLKRMTEGMKIEDEETKPAQTRKINDTVFKIILTEGKKHQIRRMCVALGYQVQELKRIRIGKIHLGQQTPGTFRRITL
jgi:23S rRNA pseudouridine2604 synthase